MIATWSRAGPARRADPQTLNSDRQKPRPFTTVHTDAAGNGGPRDITSHTVTDRRYLRLNGITRNKAYGFSIYEIGVYGDKHESCR